MLMVHDFTVSMLDIFIVTVEGWVEGNRGGLVHSIKSGETMDW